MNVVVCNSASVRVILPHLFHYVTHLLLYLRQGMALDGLSDETQCESLVETWRATGDSHNVYHYT